MTANQMLAGLCATWMAISMAHAAERHSDVKYSPPEGFAGHRWGAMRFIFERLPEQPLAVSAGWIHPQEKSVSFTCRPMPYRGPIMNGPVPACEYDATRNTLHRSHHGGGFYVLSEYTIDGQGFELGAGEDAVVLHPVVYQFCANWRHSNKRKVPENFGFLNRFCGVRLTFQSESRDELAKLPADHETVYDKALEHLLAKFGLPDRFRRKGKVIIETPGEDSAANAEPKYSIWRWCPPSRADAFTIDCEASVTLTIEPVSGRGTILYSTPILWQYAYARQKNGHKGEWLYKTLHALE
jgi:hypothetical protein